MRYLSRLLLPLFVFWLTLHCGWTVVNGRQDTARTADSILVLGNTVNPDGTLSDRLRARLDKALALYREGLAPKIVVSGGLGQEGHYEGFAMGQYLKAQGVRPADVLIDDIGTNTRASAENFAVIADRCHFRSVIAVSQYYHLPRTVLLLHQAGNFQVYQSPADYHELRDAYGLLREFPAYYVAWLRR